MNPISTENPRPPLLDRRGVRATLVLMVGIYLFMVCAAYLGRDLVVPTVSYAVLGPVVVEPDGPIILRAVAYEHNNRKPIPARISAASINAPSGIVPVNLPSYEPAIPAVVTIPKAPAEEGQFVLNINVSDAQGNERSMPIPLTVYHPKVFESPTPNVVPHQLAKDATLGLEILTEGSGLVLSALNRVWVRATLSDGTPARGISILWSAKGASPNSGKIETDVAGLAQFLITPKQLGVNFKLVAQGAENISATMSTLQRPIGRACTIFMDRLLYTPGEPPIEVTIQRKDAATDIYCDLYRGDAWLRTWHLPATQEMANSFALTLPQAGTYKLQCYTHYSSAGETADAAYLFRFDEPRHVALRTLLRGNPKDKKRNTMYRQKLPVVDSGAEHALQALYRTLDVFPTEPAIVFSTRKHDLDRANMINSRARLRFFILIGASFGLVLLWAIFMAISAAITNRTKMAEAIAELGEMAVDVAPPTGLIRARNLTQAAVIILVLILNVIAMLELFKYI